jgi:hypothetical protein
MKPAWITGQDALREGLLNPGQVPGLSGDPGESPPAPPSGLPDYLESFLAHLRLLVGVPFEYLVADARLLPEESIRFFYVDRSWTDRLVDGVLSVGKIGTREQAHHQARHPAIRAHLDRVERVVRALQRGTDSFAEARARAENDPVEARVTTGFLLRSAAVAGWPDLEVRAFTRSSPDAEPTPLPTLRLERLQSTVLVALFDGVPDLVWCEEPHHGVAFGVEILGPNAFRLRVRSADGRAVAGASPVAVPFRAGGRRVLAVAELRRRLHARHLADPGHVVSQTGPAAFALAVLSPPWRQRFEGAGGRPGRPVGGLVPVVAVAERAADPAIRAALEELTQ